MRKVVCFPSHLSHGATAVIVAKCCGRTVDNAISKAKGETRLSNEEGVPTIVSGFSAAV